MKPTQSDLRFFQLKTLPAWVNKIQCVVGNPINALHDAINSHEKHRSRRPEYIHENGNAISCLKTHRKRAYSSLMVHMQWAIREYSIIQPKRAITYRRYLRRMLKAEGFVIVKGQLVPNK